MTIRGSLPESEWLVAVEPKFMRPDSAHPVAQSERTILVPAFLDDGELVYMDHTTYESLGVGWGEYLERARRNLDAILESFEPEMIRDSNGTLQCMMYQTGHPFTASTMLASGMLARMDPLFGPELILLAPNRRMLLVFPKLASRFEEFATDAEIAYHNSPYPVSLEVFELDAEGLRAVGIFE